MEIKIIKHMIEEAVIALNKAGFGRLENPETFAIAQVAVEAAVRACDQIDVSEVED